MKIPILGLVLLFAVVTCDEENPSTTSLAPTSSSPKPTDPSTEATTGSPAATTVTAVVTTPTAAATPTTTTSSTTTPASEPTTVSPVTPPVYPSDDSKFPEPISSNVTIANSNHTCLDVKLAVQFVLSNGTKFLKLENAVRSDQHECKSENDTEITLSLTFGGNNASFVFKRDEALTSAWLDTIHLQYHADNVSRGSVDWTEKLFESNGTSANSKKYTCRGEVATELQHDAKVVFKQIEVQVGSGEHNVDVTSCPADEDVNDMIPIAVGAALLALVAIVLVAYFVGRRRSRRLAYQSV